MKSYTKQENKMYGVEGEDDDQEIIVNRVEQGCMPDAVTLPCCNTTLRRIRCC